MGQVNVTEGNGQLGATIQTADGVVGMILTGKASGDGYTLGTPLRLTRLSDLATAGITEAVNANAYRQVKDFYNEAGDGAVLYLMLVWSAMTVDIMVDGTEPAAAPALLTLAGGKINVLGAMQDDAIVEYDSEDTVSIANGLTSTVTDAISAGQVLALAQRDAHTPLRVLIGGTSYSGVPDDLTDLSAGTKNHVGVVIGDSVSNSRQASLGALLGRVARIPVQRKVSRVKDGSLVPTHMYLKDVDVAAAAGDSAAIQAKGYITVKMYPNISGYYWTGDPMAVAATDDYAMLCRGRIVDKAHRLAYVTFVQEVDDEVPVNADGTIDVAFAKYMEHLIENQINLTMIANNEITAVSCSIDLTQNVLSTNILNIVLKLTPYGYLTDIEVVLGFLNPAG